MNIPKFLASEELTILKGIFKDYVGPYIQRRLSDAMNPVSMTKEQAAQKAEEDFPPAQGDDFNADEFK
jgi:hypothetical protein